MGRRGDGETGRRGEVHLVSSPCLPVSFSSHYPVAPYPCLLVFSFPQFSVAPSPSRPVAQSPSRPISLSPCLPVSLSPCLLVSLSPCHRSPSFRLRSTVMTTGC